MVSLSVKIIVRFDNLPCFLSRIHVFKKCKVITRMAVFFAPVKNLHFHRPWRSAAGSEPPWMADTCSSAVAPALPY